MNTNTNSTSVKVPGRKSAIVRLTIMTLLIALFLVIGFTSVVDSLFEGEFDLTTAITSPFAGLALAVSLWVMIKVGCVTFPYSFRLANKFWHNFHFFGLIGAFVKPMIWIWLVALPLVILGAIFGSVLSPLAFKFAEWSSTTSDALQVVITLLLIVVLSIAAVICYAVDIRFLKNHPKNA